MAFATVDNIETYYEIYGSGTPILMCAPGGFDASIDKWRTASAWTGLDAIETLAAEHAVIAYDRRECGQSGGRVERISWASYTRQAKGLLDHLKIDEAWIMGGCMGCSVALAFAVHYPRATRGLVLHWPVGGYRWKANSRHRFTRHYDYVKANGLSGVVLVDVVVHVRSSRAFERTGEMASSRLEPIGRAGVREFRAILAAGRVVN